MSGEPVVETLESVLQEVYQALREGEFARLDDLTGRTEAALVRLVDPVDAGDVVRLRNLARRNAVCLDAAARGFRAARRRLGEIRDAQAGTRTYDGHGQSHVIGQGGGRPAHRA